LILFKNISNNTFNVKIFFIYYYKHINILLKATIISCINRAKPEKMDHLVKYYVVSRPIGFWGSFAESRIYLTGGDSSLFSFIYGFDLCLDTLQKKKTMGENLW